MLLLQHPQELRQAKNSVSLLRLCLPQAEWVVGEQFPEATLAGLLQRPGRQSVLLYPDVPAAPASRVAPPLPASAVRLVVLDATWRKSLKLLLAHPALAALPRLMLQAPPATRYRAIRTARRGDQISTLEATAHALAQIEGDAPRFEPLLQAFDRFVAREQARTGRQGPADAR